MADRENIAREETARVRQMAHACMAGQISVADYRQIRQASIETCAPEESSQMGDAAAVGGSPASDAQTVPAEGARRLVLQLMLAGAGLLVVSIGLYFWLQ